MKGIVYRSAALALACIVALSVLAVPSFATDYQSTYNFWNWAYDNSWFLGKAIIGFSAGNVCQVSEDSMHHATTHSGGGGSVDGQRVYNCVCDLCGVEFQAVATDLKETYQDIVNQYEYNSYSSDGSVNLFSNWVLVYGSKQDVDYSAARTDYGARIVHINDSKSAYWGWQYSFKSERDIIVYQPDPIVENNVSGEKTQNRNRSLSLYFSDGTLFGGEYPVTLGPGEYYFKTSNHAGIANLAAGTIEYCYVTFPSISVKLYDYSSPDINTPSTFNPSFSYDDGNGKETVSDQQIIDEQGLNYYNPVTNTTTNITNWTYDYSDRSYTCTTENNTTTTITYGDEYITINEGDVNNTYITYNIYYYTAPDSSGDGSGSGSDDSGDSDGSGDSSDGEDDGSGLLDAIGEFFGVTLGGLVRLISAALNALLDALIDLVSSAIERLTNVVDLFGSFGDALGILWSWLPEEVVTVLVSGVTVIVFASVIKLFMR